VNQLALSGCIAELSAMRYTPAGLPALNLILDHSSEVLEAGQTRQVKATMKAVAFGTLAERLAEQAIGSTWNFNGFLATPRNGKHVILHIQEFQQINAIVII
jgi:primosomal replication protein N